MRDDTILFLVVEQSSDIELIYSHENRDNQTDITVIVVDRVISARQRNYITRDNKLLFSKPTV